ncbi:TIR domain-containing protein [Ktedonosporobacter rubrisoli]|uniref:TIR domain-containing protein n=1 Tax=Ktedonosporobacter rubrisoli TaxID=2509675 RepID=A0A4P6JMF0_KTERU|nr:ABC transporter substrate-binding protein [Ktedonosporobacter rubrisoli]QBD76438.1 TIR domain-containing protein [Ktedonosporobacter rubrisoli]
MAKNPLELFYCYAPEDSDLRDQLDKRLESLRRDGKIKTWYDGEISPGDNRKQQIKEHLSTANIILLLISADFTASNYCSQQMEQISRLHKEGKVRVVPILLDSCDWSHAPFTDLEPLSSIDRRPIKESRNRNAALENVARGIRKVVEGLNSRPIDPPVAWSISAGNSGENGEGLIFPPPNKNLPDQSPVPSTPSDNVEENNVKIVPSLPNPLPLEPVQIRALATSAVSNGKSGEEAPKPSPTARPSATNQSGPLTPNTQLPGRRQQGHQSSGRSRRKGVIAISLIIFILLILLVLCFKIFLPLILHINDNDIRVWTAPDGESIGISSGQFAFDVAKRQDKDDKTEAAKKFAAGDSNGAEVLWQRANQEDPSDAEPLIYLENKRVLDSGANYVSIVVATILTGNNAHVGRDDLQGAYVAQKEFNSDHALQVRLLIANSGSGDESMARDVAEQIVKAAPQEKILGVMGWPFSESSLNAVKALGSAQIPLVSQTASTDKLTGRFPYFFRVIPPDSDQGNANASYVTQTLHAKRVALFVDPNNAYSKSFAEDFRGPYLNAGDGNSIVVTEQYTVGLQGQGDLPSLLQDALMHNPDVIYFSGYASDLNILLSDLPSTGLGSQILIVGGEGFYELGGYTLRARAHLAQLRFLSYAYPDEWEAANLTDYKPPFFQEYSQAFNPSGKPVESPYGFTRADSDSTLSYDATMTLLTANNTAYNNAGMDTKATTTQMVQQALQQIDDRHPLQGASGQIAFGPNGNPINKPILVLHFNQHQQIQEERQMEGCLLIGHCSG